jgi:tetratricopeptide (TPR) repeat protein
MQKKRHIPLNQIFDRGTVIALLTNSLRVEAYRFARNLASAWLENYPGDIVVEHIYAQALLKEERVDLAIPVIKKIVFTDPEYLPAQRLLAYSSNLATYKSVSTAQQCIRALGGNFPGSEAAGGWGMVVHNALEQQKTGNDEKAEELYKSALTQQPDSPLPAVLFLKYALENYAPENLLDLAEEYTMRWPDTIVCNLIFANALNQNGKEEQAVTLLHHAVSLDIGGQVAIRLWGSQHPYTNLWPSNPKITLELPIPANVAGTVGWNQLPQGTIKNSQPSETSNLKPNGRHHGKKLITSKKVVKVAQQELEELAVKIKNPVLGNADGRFPAYVIISSRQGLENQYGAEHLEQINNAIEMVEKNTKNLPGWNAYTVYVDDPLSTDKLSLPPAIATDPWSIKNIIKDLDQVLASKGEKIGALLIIGSEKVIPFHLLPNPIDDFDTHVPSDNPYASDDENYFIPLWPIGRLPGSAGSNPEPLIKQLNKISMARQFEPSIYKKPSWIVRFFQKIFRFPKSTSSFGYSAEVWRRASHAVYRPIGKPHHLKISPPVNARKISNLTNKTTHLAYYNLHGLEDASEWYGQRDPIEAPNGPDYPIALRPVDIRNSGRSPKIVFSEACFGANIINKKVEEAICLKFLDSGSQAVVGSTCTSYGSISTPLIAADLLGKAFWSYLKDGYSAGESLRRAKINLAKEMIKRQGYLDGEDQKTLISFILYGDPLAQSIPTNYQNAAEKGNLRLVYSPNKIKTVCDKGSSDQTDQVPTEIISQVKGIVEHYLPGMEDAKITYAHEHIHCEGHECPTPYLNSKSVLQSSPSRKVITLSKQIEKDSHTHAKHVRITINSEGKVTKLAVSR